MKKKAATIQSWEEKIDKKTKIRKKKKMPEMKVSGKQNLDLKNIIAKKNRPTLSKWK